MKAKAPWSRRSVPWVYRAAVGLVAVAILARPLPAADEPLSAPRMITEDPAAPSPYWLDNRRNCGPRCLHFLDGWFGGAYSFREISETCPPGRDGVSLRELESAIAALGWGATPFAGSVAELSRLEHPAVLHLESARAQNQYDANSNYEQNHFIVLLGHHPATDRFLIYDPPNDVRSVDRTYLADRWSGLGLLVDRRGPPALATALRPISVGPWVASIAAMILTAGVQRGRRRRRSANERIAATTFALLALALPGGCSRHTDDSPAPRHFHAGEVIEGATIPHIFQLVNGGDRPFSVTNVSASCSCTHTFLDDSSTPMAPGAKRPLRVEFNTRGERGAQRKTIVVETDSKVAEWQAIEFTIEATVLRPVQSIPDITQFGSVPRGQSVTRYVTIEANDDAWSGVEPRVVDGRHVRAVAQPGGNSRLRKYAFELTPPKTNGPLDDRVTFFCQQGGRELEVVVPVQADVTGLLKVLPRRILVTELDMTLGKRQHVRITAPGGKPFRLVDLKLPAGVATVGERPQAAAVEHDLEFEIDGAKLPADGRLIGIVTDLAEDARLEIPVVLTEHAAKKT